MAALAAMRDQCTVKYLVWSNTTVDWLALTEACGCRSRTFHRRRRINAHMERLAGSYNSHRSRDEWGQTPIDVAVILGQKDIADPCRENRPVPQKVYRRPVMRRRNPRNGAAIFAVPRLNLLCSFSPARIVLSSFITSCSARNRQSLARCVRRGLTASMASHIIYLRIWIWLLLPPPICRACEATLAIEAGTDCDF